jgi:hypothetical protein
MQRKHETHRTQFSSSVKLLEGDRWFVGFVSENSFRNGVGKEYTDNDIHEEPKRQPFN